MKGLLYKDFFSLWRISKIIIVISAALLIYFIFGHQQYLLLLTESAILLSGVISTLGTAEHNICWNVFVGTLPLSRAKIVFEKYFFIIILSSGAVVFYYAFLILQKTVHTDTYQFVLVGDMMAPVILFTIIVVSSCLNQIFILCFDPVVGKNFHLSFMVLSIIVLSATGKSVLRGHFDIDPIVFSAVALCISFAVLGVSFVISYLVYRKKDLV